MQPRKRKMENTREQIEMGGSDETAQHRPGGAPEEETGGPEVEAVVEEKRAGCEGCGRGSRRICSHRRAADQLGNRDSSYSQEAHLKCQKGRKGKKGKTHNREPITARPRDWLD